MIIPIHFFMKLTITHLDYFDFLTQLFSQEVTPGNFLRTAKSPMCYAEALLQDNGNEAQLLRKTPIEITKTSLKGPKRADDVALAYFEAIQKMALDLNCQKDKIEQRQNKK